MTTKIDTTAALLRASRRSASCVSERPLGASSVASWLGVGGEDGVLAGDPGHQRYLTLGSSQA